MPSVSAEVTGSELWCPWTKQEEGRKVAEANKANDCGHAGATKVKWFEQRAITYFCRQTSTSNKGVA